MPKPLSMDLRERVVAVYEAGKGTMEHVAAMFNIGVATLVRLLALKRKTGSLKWKPPGGGTPRRLTEWDLETLKTLVMEKPDATLAELAEGLEKRIQKGVSVKIVFDALRRIKYTRKKKQHTPSNKRHKEFKTCEPSIGKPSKSLKRRS